jgi:hypothetical protein
MEIYHEIQRPRRDTAMNRVCSIFAQLLQLLPRSEFQAAVARHKTERHARGFSCWTHCVSMLFCQLANARSLREITQGLAASEGKLKHLGVDKSPGVSTLAYANQHRSWELYRTVFGSLFERCTAAAAQRGKKKFRFKNKLLSLDATMMPVCLSVFDWAHYQRSKGAVKLHLMLDHDGYLPKFAVITDGKTHEIEVARKMQFEPGAMLVFDRGYVDYQWWLELSRQKVSFVTRLKDSGEYGVVDSRPLPPNPGNVLRDEVILLTAIQEQGPAAQMRRIEIWIEDKNVSMALLTNNLKLAASTIAAIYKDRWQIEVFFRAIKQSLRIKTFVGTSPNAVMIQIWTALIAMLLLRYLQLRATYGWSLSNLVALLRQQLFVYRDLMKWLNEPFQPPPELSDQLILRFA